MPKALTVAGLKLPGQSSALRLEARGKQLRRAQQIANFIHQNLTLILILILTLILNLTLILILTLI